MSNKNFYRIVYATSKKCEYYFEIPSGGNPLEIRQKVLTKMGLIVHQLLKSGEVMIKDSYGVSISPKAVKVQMGIPNFKELLDYEIIWPKDSVPLTLLFNNGVIFELSNESIASHFHASIEDRFIQPYLLKSPDPNFLNFEGLATKDSLEINEHKLWLEQQIKTHIGWEDPAIKEEKEEEEDEFEVPADIREMNFITQPERYFLLLEHFSLFELERAMVALCNSDREGFLVLKEDGIYDQEMIFLCMEMMKQKLNLHIEHPYDQFPMVIEEVNYHCFRISDQHNWRTTSQHTQPMMTRKGIIEYTPETMPAELFLTEKIINNIITNL